MVYQFFRFFPAKAGVGNGFSINMLADFLAARFDIALNHQAFYQLMNLRRNPAVVHNLFDNAYLLFILFVGIGMV